MSRVTRGLQSRVSFVTAMFGRGEEARSALHIRRRTAGQRYSGSHGESSCASSVQHSEMAEVQNATTVRKRQNIVKAKQAKNSDVEGQPAPATHNSV